MQLACPNNREGKIIMSKDSRKNTYTRIVESSLQLFNEHGERNISTNHIANHLNISPGNLYYHFANKDEIIVQLFKRYSRDLLDYLTHTTLPINMSQTTEYMAGVYEVMWNYRFLFSDVNALLRRSAELLGAHNDFTHEKVSPLTVKLLTKLQDNQIITIDEVGIHDLAVNMWLTTKYWFDFDRSLTKNNTLNERTKLRGIYRTLSLIRPYIRADHLAEFDKQMVNFK